MIIGGVILLILVVVFLFSISSDDEDTQELPPASVEPSVGHDDGTSVDIDREVSDEAEVDGDVDVYKIDKTGHVANVKNFIKEMNKDLWVERSYDNESFIWAANSTENRYLIDYDTISERLTFTFPEPVPTRAITDGGLLTDEELDEYMDDFFREYLGLPFNFENYKIIQNRDSVIIQSNRVIDDLLLHTRGPDYFTDYVEIDESGGVINGSLLLMEYLEPGVGVEIVNPGLIGSVVNRTDYPKEFHQLALVGYQDEFPEVDFSDSNFLGDAYDVEPVPQVTSCTAQSMELVYYFTTTYNDELLPTYWIDCPSTTSIDGVEYEVPVVVYTNALDPNLVYVPEGVQ